MHVLPEKHSYVWLPDRRTRTQKDGQTDPGQSDPYVPLCLAGDTINKILFIDPINSEFLLSAKFSDRMNDLF